MNRIKSQTNTRWYLAGIGVVLIIVAAILMRPAPPPEPQATPGNASVIAPPSPRAEKKAEVSADAQLLLAQMRAAYEGLKSAEFVGVASSSIDADGEEQKTTTKFASSFSAPDKFRHEAEDDLTAGSNGEKVFVFNKAANEYLLLEAPQGGGVEQLPGIIPELLQAQNPSLLFALLNDPTSQFLTGFEKISRGPDVEMEGKKHPALVLESAQEQGDLTLVLDGDTHLLKQLRVDLKSSLEQRGVKEIKLAEVVVDYTSVKTGLDFPQTHFAWAPPQDARDVTASRGPAEQQANAALVGEPAPNFQLKTLDGKTVSLAELKGQVVVLDFWASWCPPCIESLPHLGKFYQETRDDGVKVFAVNLGEDKAKIEAFLKSKRVAVPVLLDAQGEVARKYNVVSIPQTVVIGKDGTVKNVFIGLGENSFEQIRQQVAEERAAS